METKHILQLLLGSFSIILGNLLLSGFSATTSDVNAVITFLMAFFLVFIGGLLWVATAVALSREI